MESLVELKPETASSVLMAPGRYGKQRKFSSNYITARVLMAPGRYGKRKATGEIYETISFNGTRQVWKVFE